MMHLIEKTRLIGFIFSFQTLLFLKFFIFYSNLYNFLFFLMRFLNICNLKFFYQLDCILYHIL